MDSLSKESQYSPLASSHDQHFNHDDEERASLSLNSDSHTFTNEDQIDSFLGQKRTSRISSYERSSRLSDILTWARWGTIVFFQGVIIILLLPTSGLMGEGWGTGLSPWSEKPAGGENIEVPGWSIDKTETGGDVNGLYVPTSHKYTLLTPDEEKFVPNMSDPESNRMEIRKNWDMLMPLGSGSVSIPDYLQHPMLGKPIATDPIRSGPVFEASWTHALHCLYYTVDSYHQIVTSNATKFGFKGERNDYHAGHCFEYLRNQILCMSDMTLEGSESVLDASGDGQAHMCRNREEAVAWIEDRRVDDIQSIVGP